jgi:hypothetical protein
VTDATRAAAAPGALLRLWHGLRFVEGLARLRAIIDVCGRPLPRGEQMG